MDVELDNWSSLVVPNEDSLLMRVHVNSLKKGQLHPGIFGNNPKDDPTSGMSTDWEKYSTPEQTRGRGAQPPEMYKVVRLSTVGDVRQTSQIVKHTPDRERANFAHTDVFGQKTPEVRVMLYKLVKVVLEGI